MDPRRKLAIIAAIGNGLMSREDVYNRYFLSPEKLLSWEKNFDRHGLRGLAAKAVRGRRHKRFIRTRPKK
jgi:hypothetical protein